MQCFVLSMYRQSDATFGRDWPEDLNFLKWVNQKQQME